MSTTYTHTFNTQSVTASDYLGVRAVYYSPEEADSPPVWCGSGTIPVYTVEQLKAMATPTYGTERSTSGFGYPCAYTLIQYSPQLIAAYPKYLYHLATGTSIAYSSYLNTTKAFITYSSTAKKQYTYDLTSYLKDDDLNLGISGISDLADEFTARRASLDDPWLFVGVQITSSSSALQDMWYYIPLYLKGYGTITGSAEYVYTYTNDIACDCIHPKFTSSVVRTITETYTSNVWGVYKTNTYTDNVRTNACNNLKLFDGPEASFVVDPASIIVSKYAKPSTTTSVFRSDDTVNESLQGVYGVINCNPSISCNDWATFTLECSCEQLGGTLFSRTNVSQLDSSTYTYYWNIDDSADTVFYIDVDLYEYYNGIEYTHSTQSYTLNSTDFLMYLSRDEGLSVCYPTVTGDITTPCLNLVSDESYYILLGAGFVYPNGDTTDKDQTYYGFYSVYGKPVAGKFGYINGLMWVAYLPNWHPYQAGQYWYDDEFKMYYTSTKYVTMSLKQVFFPIGDSAPDEVCMVHDYTTGFGGSGRHIFHGVTKDDTEYCVHTQEGSDLAHYKWVFTDLGFTIDEDDFRTS